MKRLAIFGGTFNPVHIGHLMLADAALTQQNLDAVLWVPTRYAHYKASNQALDLTHRIEMVQRAIATHAGFTLVALDQPASGISYAADLFQQLQSRYPNTDWSWVVGLDAFQSLPRWHDRDRLIPHCTWLIAPRLSLDKLAIADVCATAVPKTIVLDTWLGQHMQTLIQSGVQQLEEQGLSVRWRSLQMPLVSISSQLIRQYCQGQHSIRYLVPEAVYEYIMAHHLYRSANEPS